MKKLFALTLSVSLFFQVMAFPWTLSAAPWAPMGGPSAPAGPSAPSYTVEGSFTARTIQTNQQGQSARNASITLEIGGYYGFPALNNTSTQCFNQWGPGPAYAYGIFLDNSSLNISQCEAYNGTNIVRLSAPLIIDPFTAFTTKATATEIANAIVARGYLYEVGTTNQAFTITSGGGRNVVFTRTNTNDGNINYTNSIIDSSDAFRIVWSPVSGQSFVQSLVQQSTFTPANVGSGETYIIDIDGYNYYYTAKAGDGVSDVTAGLIAQYNMAAVPFVSCVDQTTRILCSAALDHQSFTIDAYVTYPTPDTVAPLLTLVGSANYSLEYGTPFSDPGATWIDNRNGTGTVMGSGSVDHLTLGTYTLTYDISDHTGNAATGLTRAVTVADTTAPTLTLIGSGTLTVEIDDGYEDEWAEWTDIRDGSGTVYADTYTINALWNKTLTYQYVDAAGNTGTLTRTLNVVDTIAPTLSLNTAPTTVDANVFPVRGNIGGYGSVTISGGASPVTLSNVNNSFTAYVPLTQNTVNTLLITATDLWNNVSTGTLVITESGAANGFSGAISMNGSSLSLSGVTSLSGVSLTGATRLVVEAPIFFWGKGGMGTIPSATVITPASGTGTFDATSINRFNVTVTGGLSSNETQQGTVGFGIADTGLHFSKPVKIEIPLTSYSGTTIEVKVRHGGTSTFVTTGLTNTPTATCSNGVASIPSNIATVISNTATIYTCAASAFVAYTSTAVASSASSGGGGGGSFTMSTTAAPSAIPVLISTSGSVMSTATGYTLSGVVSRLKPTQGFRSELTGTLMKVTPIVFQTTLPNKTKVKVYRIVGKKKILVSTLRVKNGTITLRTKQAGVYEFVKTR